MIGFRSRLSFVVLALIVLSCDRGMENPAAEGFDGKNSDPVAIGIADSVMMAMGGRKNWDQTAYITWDFFDRRRLVWDKQNERVRIESFLDSTIYLLDLRTNEGRVRLRGRELTQPDSLKEFVERGKGIWINDSYWLVMPFKLKDSGVTLRYLGEDTTLTGIRAKVLELTFREVGVTPNNKYRVYVDQADHLVKQWAYYKEASQDSPSQVWPWDNYRQYGRILLSADRSDKRGPRNVRVDNQLPEALFTDF